MKTATTILATLAALLIAGSVPAAAQLVVGGEVPDGVVVNWSVLERLGPAPNLATLLRAPGGTAPDKHVVYRPYAPAKPVARAVAKPAKLVRPVAPKAAAAKPAAGERIKPVSAPAEPPKQPIHSAALPPPRPELVEPLPPVVKAPPVAKVPPVEHPKPVEVAKPVEPPKPVEVAKPAELPKPVEVVKPVEPPKPVEVAKGPQISLPEAPKVTPPPPPVAKPVEIARIELPPPPPPAAVAAKPASLPSQASGAVIKKGDTMTVVFPADTSRLPDPAWNDLGALAQRMIKDESLSLQLLAYADGDDAATSKARRLSLSRALAVRTFLMDQGVRSTRIDVRALGNKIEGDGPRDRVDLVLAAH